MAKRNLIVAVVLFCVGVASAEEAGGHPGVICGTVVDAESGEAIAGAYVGVGEFGDSGGTNRSRHRQQGWFAKGKTDSEGKFELDGLVLTKGHSYLTGHPLVATHEDYGTSLVIKTPAEPFAGMKEFENAPKDYLKGKQIRGLLNISRNIGLRAWDMGRVYHVEDARLGRIQRGAMFFTMVAPGESFTIENLPPGRYAAFSMANVKVVMAISSATVEVVAGRDAEVEMPVAVIEGIGEAGTHTFDRSVELADRGYSVKELCGIVSEATESSPELVADSAIENEVVRIGGGEIVMWELIERLCAEKGLKLKDMGRKKLGIGLR